MMKKTMAQRDNATDIHDLPECTTYADELEAIQKASEPEPEEEEQERPDAEMKDAPLPAAPTPAPVASLAQVVSVAEIEDVPPTAADALVTIVAAGLKMARNGVDLTQSIKFLAKGKFKLLWTVPLS